MHTAIQCVLAALRVYPVMLTHQSFRVITQSAIQGHASARRATGHNDGQFNHCQVTVKHKLPPGTSPATVLL